MSLKIQVDDNLAQKLLEELGKPEQLKFAMSLAINKTMTLIRNAFRGEMEAKLKLRRVAFNLAAVRVKPGDFATKSQLYSILSIDAALAPHLIRLQTGKDHIAVNGRKYLPMPNVKVFGDKVITSANPIAIKNLQLRSTPGGLKGQQKTFMLHPAGKSPVILQRTGQPGKGKKKGSDKATGNRILYTLIKKSKTPKKIDLLPIAQRVVREVFRDEVRSAVAYAVKTAKKK